MNIWNSVRITVLASALCAGGTAWARNVDYSGGPEALIQSGRELKIEPLTTSLSPSIKIMSVKVDPAADHETLKLGIYCTAYKVNNPISLLFPIVQDEWNAALASTLGSTNAIAVTPVDLKITSASSYRRCVEISELNVRCITRIRIAGTARRADENESTAIPISADVERNASVGGFCGSLARGEAVISREAALALFMAAQAQLSNKPAAN